MRSLLAMLLGLALLLVAVPALAQEQTVPDLTGLNTPQAAAALNRVGVRLGAEFGEPWTPDSGLAQGAIRAQSVAPGTPVTPDLAVDVIVLRAPNAQLIYDDNDITLVNDTGGMVDLNDISFRALDGNGATFAAGRWGAALRPERCAQLWSVGRNGPKGLDECRFIEHWQVSTRGDTHFWTGAGGTTQFAVLAGGVERARCTVANPGRCEFYLPASGASGDVTPYVYFAYSADQLAIINTSTDRWMPLGSLIVINNHVNGAPVPVGDPTLFGRGQRVGDVSRLAPGQCLLFTNSQPTSDAPPAPCDVIARLDIGTDLIFWASAFGVRATTSPASHTCPAASPDALTLCIMPR